MNKKILLLFVLVSNLSVSFAQDEGWDVYMAQYEKGAGSTLINMLLKNEAPIKQYPYLLKVGVDFANCDADGFPTKEEFDVLYQISDQMKAVIDANIKSKPAGTFTYQCQRMDYYYINDTSGIRASLEAAFQKKFTACKYFISIKNDESWKAYLEFLYPNEETQEYMRNSKIILALTQQGDDLTKPRQVDHWLYFSNEAAREKFISYAEHEHFKVENKGLVNDAKLKYQLHLSRTDKVDLNAITKITSELKKKAEELKGDYDGWETFVVKSN